jgi:hypothetical protein
MRQLSFSTHQDASTGDWVLRVSYGDSFVSIGSINGEQEACLLVGSLNAICCDPASMSDHFESLWIEYMGPTH